MAEEAPFRLRPRAPRPRYTRDNPKVWAGAFKKLAQMVRQSAGTSVPRPKARSQRRSNVPQAFRQRCAIRVSYSKNQVRGQWAAHGKYVMREAAVDPGGFEQASTGAAFDREGAVTDMPERLGSWQREGDQRVFKIIISPEFGERMDLQKLTRDLLGRMEKDLGVSLEWIGACHYNTQHPHVHVSVRGVAGGMPFLIPREYIRAGIRHQAEESATLLAGYRTQLDIEDAEKAEIGVQRVTSLDRILKRAKTGEAEQLFVDVEALARTSVRRQHLTARLVALESMGLAERAEEGWKIRGDFEEVLRSMQRAGDRQKVLAAHGGLLSDERLRMTVTPARSISLLEGRVLSHGLDDERGASFMLLEGTDGQVHYIPHSSEIENARSGGLLKVNSLVTLERRSKNLQIVDHGDAERFLDQGAEYFRDRAKKLLSRNLVPNDPAWGGWLGRFEAKVQSHHRAEQQRHIAREVERTSNRRWGLGR